MDKQELTIPEFTAEQYLHTTDPYEWLAQYLGNKFQLNQMSKVMKERAAAVGVKGFIGLWQDYLSAMKGKPSGKVDNVTMFTDQAFELFSGPYICDDRGVHIFDRFGFEVEVCPHPIMPIRRLVNIDEGDERMEIAFRKGWTWRTIIVERVDIASSASILSLASHGVNVSNENAKLLSAYLLNMEHYNYETLEEAASVGRLGWIPGHGFSPYVDHLVFDGEANFRNMFQAVRSEGSRAAWIDAMKLLRAEKSIGRVFLAASFASALVKPCGLLPFFVHAYGGQGTGKTVSLMIAASVWANPAMGEYIMTFNATDVGQEMVAAFLNSLPLCMDELQIQASSGVKDFDKMIYKLTEGIGRVRGARSGGIRRTVTWKNCMLTTGEYPIINANSMGGATVRVVEFECADKVYSDLPSLSSVLYENYGFTGREFVDYLCQDNNIETIKAVRKEIYRDLIEAGGEDKQAASLSAILVADQVATQLFFQDGNELTVDDMIQIMTKKSDIDANVRAMNWLQDFVVINTNHFVPSDLGEYRAEVWGKIEPDCIYIIKSVFDREMRNAGYNSASFLSWAKRRALIVTDLERRTKAARINGSVALTVCVDRFTLRQLSGVDLQTEMDNNG